MIAYDAFISYSHAKDKAIAAALQRALQKLGKPWYRRRAIRVFRDDTSLSATPHLWPSIETALDQSRFFILIASPASAASAWVDKEVAHWLAHKSIDTLLLALTEGELVWDNAQGAFADTTPLPPALKRKFRNEPRWIDLRAYREGPAPREAYFVERAAEFAAAIRGIPKEDLLSLELLQQRRAVALALTGLVAVLILAASAAWQWRNAVVQREAAIESQRAAEAQRDKALLAESRLLTDLSNQQRVLGDFTSAILLAMEALPAPDASDPLHGRPYLVDAQRAFYQALEARTELEVHRTPSTKLLAALFDLSDPCVVHASHGKATRTCPHAPEPLTERVLGSPDDELIAAGGKPLRILAWTKAGTLRLWDFETSQMVAELPAPKGEPFGASLDASGDHALIRYHPEDEDGRTAWIDYEDFKGRKQLNIPIEQGASADAAAFSRDGDAFAIAIDGIVSICAAPSQCEPFKSNPLADRRATKIEFDQSTGAVAVLLRYAPSFDEQSRMEPGEHYISDRGQGEFAGNNYNILRYRKNGQSGYVTVEPERGIRSRDNISGFDLDATRKALYIGYASGLVREIALDATTQDRSRFLAGHLSGITDIAYDASKYRFTTYGDDATIRLWSEYPTFSWNLGLELQQSEINPDDDPDFHIRTDILAEIEENKKEAFLKAIEEMLKKPDYERLAAAQNALPRCLHPDQRAKFGLSPERPAWCMTLKKWPFDTAEPRPRQ